MTKRISIAWLIAAFLLLITGFVVYAGAGLDMGTIVSAPQEGEANWTAWRTLDVPVGGGAPYEILTEDNINSSEGVNLGYIDTDEDGVPEWLLIVRNFASYGPGNEINILFGGLGSTWSGTNWFYSFNWLNTEPITVHSPVSVSTNLTEACPTIVKKTVEGDIRSTEFLGQPLSTYYVYRSQNAACDGCQRSNGDYFYLKTITTNELGEGLFSDSTDLESWYMVIKAGDSTSALGGCHSEEAFPTAVSVSGFEAAYLPETPAIQLTWETASEVNLLSFNVLRSESLSGDKETVAQLAVQNPGSLVGGSYAYQDEKVLFGQTYFYWLEIFHLDGSREVLGPLQETVGYMVYLPISLR